MGPLSVAAALDFASNIRSNLLTKFPLISNFPFSLCHLNIYIYFFRIFPVVLCTFSIYSHAACSLLLHILFAAF